MNRLTREPVTAAVLAPIVTWLLAYFGFDADADTAAWIAGAVLTVLGLAARHFVTPVADPKDSQGHQLVPVETPPNLPPTSTTGPAV